MVFCCETPVMFCGLQNRFESRECLNIKFWVDLSFNSQLLKCSQTLTDSRVLIVFKNKTVASFEGMRHCYYSLLARL